MAFSSSKPIPLFQDQNQHHSNSHSRAPIADNRPPASHNVQISANDRREKPGRGAARPYVKTSDESDPYGIDTAL